MHKFFYISFLTMLLASCANTPGQPASESLHTIPLELTTHLGDQQKFNEGDEIQFLLSLGSNAYIYMYYIDANNNITQIIPNRNQTSNYYTAGYFLTVPEYNNGYRFIISKPFGEESIWVFASDQSITLSGTYHSIDEVRLKLKGESKTAFGEYVLKISTRKK